ncbi:MAG: DUF3568 family protein [Candidatus Omnitrophota bacterium]
MKNLFKGICIFICGLSLSGCIFVVGAAVGAAGGYVISKDTIQGETDKGIASIWQASIDITQIMGTIKTKDIEANKIEAEIEGSHVVISITSITPATRRLKVTSRKNLLPNLKLAEKIFVNIMQRLK